jgi:hypothetical protein
MADTYSSKLRLRYQATGANTNVWGALLNAAVFQLLEDSVCGLVQVPVSVGDVTLTQVNGGADQARMAIIDLIGAPTLAFNVNVPALSKLYLVRNNTGQIATVKTASGTGIPINAANNQWLACDGTNVIAIQASSVGTVTNSLQLGGIVAANYARLDIANQFTGGNATSFSNLTDAPTITLNALLSNCFYCLLAGNRTLAITNPGNGQPIEIWFQQDGTGSRTMTWPGNVVFEGGSTGTLSTTPNATDRFQLTYNLTLNKYIARSAIGAAVTGATLVINAASVDVSVFALAGSPGGVVTVNVTTPAGTVLRATSAVTPALDFSGFASGSTINWTNLGYIQGCGGDGAQGGELGAAGSTVTDWSAGKAGTPGGPAVKGPGTGRNFNITNAAGFIWGGGGGGGGGGVQGSGAPMAANGGGGGGGAGGGRGGLGGSSASSASVIGGNGVSGGAGINGDFGAGGAGNHGGGTSSGGAGGAGGTWGTAGAAGVTVSGAGNVAAAGVGGAAGKAIDANGGTVSFVSGSGGPNVKGAVA